MITFIIAACAVAVMAMQLHTTIVYTTLFLCGAIALPLFTALQLTIIVLIAWGMVEMLLHARLQMNGCRLFWQAGNFQLAIAM